MLLKRLSKYAGTGVLSLIGFFGPIEKTNAEDAKAALQSPPKTEHFLDRENGYENFVAERFFEHMERRLQEQLPFQYLILQNPSEMRDFVRGVFERSATRTLSDYANIHPLVLGLKNYAEEILKRASDGLINGALRNIKISLSNRADDSRNSLEEVVYDVEDRPPFEKNFRLKLGVGAHPYLGAGYGNAGLRAYYDKVTFAFDKVILPKIHFEVGTSIKYNETEPEAFVQIAQRNYDGFQWGLRGQTIKNMGERNNSVLMFASINF